MGRHDAEPPRACACRLGDQPGAPDFQPAANLSAGWRANPALAAMVRGRKSEKPAMGGMDRIRRRGGIDSPRAGFTLGVDRRDLRVHFAELLEWPKARTGPGADRETPEARRLRMPILPDGTPGWAVLDLRSLPPTIRYVRGAGGLPQLLGEIFHHAMPGLRRTASAQ